MVVFQENEITEAWEDIFQNVQYRYRLEIQELADSYPDKKSILVDYPDIDAYNTDMAMYMLENPDQCLTIGKTVLLSLMPANWDPKHAINLRIQKLPRDSKVAIRKLRETQLGKLVAVEGLVKKASSVRPRMTYARFTCSRCGAEIWEPQSGMYLREPLMCPNPNGTCNKQVNRFILDGKSCHFIDTQKVEIQESPEGLKGGQQPEKISGFVEDDLSGIVVPGNRITINGIIRPVEKSDRDKSTIFEIYMDVLSVEFEQHEYDEINITEEDEKRILEMSKDPNLFENIVKSIAPTIYGMDEVKQAVALQLFGGCRKVMDDGSVIRGDTHILLIGDPGVAKSQILRYMSSLSPRGIFASGKSATAAGLTAAAVKDDFSGDGFVLEAGALVLADKGLACIDELDKMTEQDTSSLHEAMESQKISIAKAGITATLQCRCSLLAAANPELGRFNKDANLVEQVKLPPALMSRFDLMFPLLDVPDEKYDRKVTNFILDVHQRGQVLQHDQLEQVEGVDLQAIRDKTSKVKPYYEAEVLRKYVAYAKRFTPILTEGAKKLIVDTYMDIRTSGGSDNGHAVPITARQLEAFVRLSEASAKMRLSPRVEESDAQRAIYLVKYYLHKFAGDGDGLDADLIMTGTSTKQRRDSTVFKKIIMSEGKKEMTLEEIVMKAAEIGINESEVKEGLEKMTEKGYLYCPKQDVYKVV